MGHIVEDGKIVHWEEVEKGLVFCVIQKYMRVYDKPNYGESSMISIEAVISDGTKHTWSNKVESVEDASEFQQIKDGEDWPPLRELKTKHGYRAFQHPFAEISLKEYRPEGGKQRKVMWLVQVPSQDLHNFYQL